MKKILDNPDMYYGKSSEDIRDNEQEGINMLLKSKQRIPHDVISITSLRNVLLLSSNRF